MEKITAVVLAAGAGKRMHSDVHKQYMMLAGRPVLFYALQAFAESAVTDIVVVVGAGEIDYCRKRLLKNIISKRSVRSWKADGNATILCMKGLRRRTGAITC